MTSEPRKQSHSYCVALLIFAVLMLLGFTLSADPSSIPGNPREQELELWGDISLNTTSLGALSSSDVRHRKLLIVGLRYGFRVAGNEHHSLFYTIDLIPVAIAFHSAGGENPESQMPIRSNIAGWGISPLGLKMHFRRGNALQPFLAFNGGFLHFQHAVPNPTGTRWNFTAAVGGGLRCLMGSRYAVDAGYMFHHMSNGRAPVENPSLNTNVFSFGLSYSLCGPH